MPPPIQHEHAFEIMKIIATQNPPSISELSKLYTTRSKKQIEIMNKEIPLFTDSHNSDYPFFWEFIGSKDQTKYQEKVKDNRIKKPTIPKDYVITMFKVKEITTLFVEKKITQETVSQIIIPFLQVLKKQEFKDKYFSEENDQWKISEYAIKDTLSQLKQYPKQYSQVKKALTL